MIEVPRAACQDMPLPSRRLLKVMAGSPSPEAETALTLRCSMAPQCCISSFGGTRAAARSIWLLSADPLWRMCE